MAKKSINFNDSELDAPMGETELKKSLGNLAEEERKDTADFTEQNKNSERRLTFNVTGDQHTQFKKDAANAGISMTEYFLRLWQGKQ